MELICYKDFPQSLRTYERNSQKCGFCGCYKKGKKISMKIFSRSLHV
nr:MAG TPA: hypothetical protein [Herelleviridae sp.]DAR48323.1 MAG TPA: hypothetical protein [Caudoviricetes sp.]